MGTNDRGMSRKRSNQSRQSLDDLLQPEGGGKGWLRSLSSDKANRYLQLGLMVMTVIPANIIAYVVQLWLYEYHWNFAVETLSPLHLYVATPVITTVTTLLVGAPVILYATGQYRGQRMAVRRADAANRAKSNFLATTSHEIRTPLNGILGMAQVLARSDLSDEQRRNLEIMINSAKMLSNQLDDILDLSKVEAGRMALAPRRTDFIAMIREIHALWSAQAGLKGLTMPLSIGPDVPEYQICDPHRVQQCVGNLISNAVKFTQEGSIAIRVSRRDLGTGRSVIEIAIHDTGPGISPDDLSRIFMPFEQTAISERTAPGTGLGLAIANQLASMMGGGISAQSIVGRGTTMLFTLPETPAEAPEPVAEPAPQARAAPVPAKRQPDSFLRPLRILAVDDSATNLLVIENLLQIDGHDVLTAMDATGALEMLAAHEIDLVLMDIHMPGIDGIEALSAIRDSAERWRDVPVIALTADAMTGDRERYINLGMNGYVTKPIDMEHLSSEIATVIASDESRSVRLLN